MSAFVSMFLLVFLAELADKAQVATAMFAAAGNRPAWLVFAASSAARVASSAIATLAGGAAVHVVQGPWLKVVAGFRFHPHRRADFVERAALIECQVSYRIIAASSDTAPSDDEKPR
jgi:hypothetical protein